MLTVYTCDLENHKSSLFSSYPCNSDLLCLAWGYGAGGCQVLFGTQEGSYGLFDTSKNTVSVESSSDGAAAIIDVAFAPQMNHYCVVAASSTRTVTFRDVENNAMLLDGSCLGSRVIRVEYLPTSNGAFFSTSDGHILLFDFRNGKVVNDESVGPDPISGLKLVPTVSTDEPSSLFCCSVEGVVREFDIRNMSSISF